MAKAVLISIRPEWVKKILAGEKTIEVRKTRPKSETPFKCCIYCTNSGVAMGMWEKHGKVVAEFVCDTIFPIQIECNAPAALGAGIEVPGTCLTDRKIMEYLGNGKRGFAWHISNLKIYDAPKPLSEFKGFRKTKFGYAPVEIKRPPQSWCYVEELINGQS